MRKQRKAPRQSTAPAAVVGQCLDLVLDRLSHDGRGIGVWQGRTVFVEGGLPGEQVRARVVRARSKLIEARLESVQQASVERLAPPCTHASLCGGCSVQHMSQPQQLAFKQAALAQQLRHFAAVEPAHWAEPLQAAAYGYRQRTRLALHYQAATDQLTVGYRQRASKALVAVEQCPVLVPALQSLLAELPALLQQLDARSQLGHVDLLDNLPAPVLLLRHLRPLSVADTRRLADFSRRLSVPVWLQPADADSAQPLLPDSPAQLCYTLADQGLTLHYAPGDFTQVNPAINQAMINQALDWLQPTAGQRLLDLFCGLGNFALPLAQRGAEVTGVEGSAVMVDRARANARHNGLQAVHFFTADLSKPLEADWMQQHWDAALLDPPRDGAEQLVQTLAEWQIPRILYVSCNPATLARDAGLLAARGYRLQQCGVMDMFPQTAHIESMALFVRDGKKNRKR